MMEVAGLFLSGLVVAVQPAPVDVTNCAAYMTNNAQFGGSPVLAIGFTNTSERTISSITFGVTSGSQPEAEVTDKGTFSTGAHVNHSFSSPVSGVTHTNCVVRSVTFSDGGQWVAGAEPPVQR